MLAKIMKLGQDSISEAADVVARGGLIVYPTDTVYGLGCDPFNEKALQHLFEAKSRAAKPIPVLCSNLQKAAELVQLSAKGEALARDNWPGALTIVGPLKQRMPFLLSQGTGNLGVRVPAGTTCLKLISSCGGWLTGTSANLSGRPSARTAQEAAAQIGDSVEIILDGGSLSGKESTVVLIVGEEVTILRSGPVGVKEETNSGRTS
jgi:L-threonylcarbamoyladenylate synthase